MVETGECVGVLRRRRMQATQLGVRGSGALCPGPHTFPTTRTHGASHTQGHQTTTHSSPPTHLTTHRATGTHPHTQPPHPPTLL